MKELRKERVDLALGKCLQGRGGKPSYNLIFRVKLLRNSTQSAQIRRGGGEVRNVIACEHAWIGWNMCQQVTEPPLALAGRSHSDRERSPFRSDLNHLQLAVREMQLVVREIRGLRNPSNSVFAGSQGWKPYVKRKPTRRSFRRRDPATQCSVLIIPEFQPSRGNELARSHEFQPIAAKIPDSRPKGIVNPCRRFGMDPDGFSCIRRLINSHEILNDIDAGGCRRNLA